MTQDNALTTDVTHQNQIPHSFFTVMLKTMNFSCNSNFESTKVGEKKREKRAHV